MGRRGPAPKPTVLKHIEGTYRKDREAKDAPRPEPGVPEIPEGWGEAVPWGSIAVAEYYAITPWLLETGLLSKGDRAALLAYCDSWGRWCHYRERVGREGEEVEIVKGVSRKGDAVMGTVTNPAVWHMNRALADAKKFLALFGLSPADRTRVSAQPTPERGVFDEFRRA